MVGNVLTYNFQQSHVVDRVQLAQEITFYVALFTAADEYESTASGNGRRV